MKLKLIQPAASCSSWSSATATARRFTRGSGASPTGASSRRLFFFALFVFLLWMTWFSRLGGYPVSLFLEIDPLVTFATALSTHTVYRWLWRAMWILIPTLLLGRVFCGWICPYGTMHQFIGWVFNIRKNRQNIDVNAYRPIFQLKYYGLTIFLVLAAFGSLQIGLLDPICLLVRSFAVALKPGADAALPAGIDFLRRVARRHRPARVRRAPGSWGSCWWRWWA